MFKDNCTLLDELLNIGGVVIRSVDMSTGEILTSIETGSVITICESNGGGDEKTATRRLEVPLSTLHKRTRDGVKDAAISPYCEYRKGASLLKVSKAEPCKPPVGGRRGVVKGFSAASRRKLMRTIAGVRRDAELPCFITLTYPKQYPEPRESKRHLNMFIRRMKRAFPDAGFIWKLEPQKRGAPHYHLLSWGCDEKALRGFVPMAWFEIAGGGDALHLAWHEGKLKNKHCVSRVYSYRGVQAYASKYLGKTFQVAGWDSKDVGRFWSVVMPKNIPFGEPTTEPITREQAVQVMRLQKRFAKLKGRSYPSITTFCDAEQWIEKLKIGGDKT